MFCHPGICAPALALRLLSLFLFLHPLLVCEVQPAHLIGLLALGVVQCLKPTGASPPAAAETTGGQQDERTATCPAKQCPIMSDLAPSCAGLAIDRRHRSNQIESHCSKTEAGAVLAPRPKPRSRPRFQGHPRTVTLTCGNLCTKDLTNKRLAPWPTPLD